MPRPDINPLLLQEWITDQKALMENPPQEMVAIYADPEVRDRLIEISIAGNWLYSELMAIGVPKGSADQICFALGQHGFYSLDVWDTAQGILDRVRQENAPAPQIAEQLHAEMMSVQSQKLFDHFSRVHAD